jgi:polyisoprenoid-binding protein YceI
VILAGSAASLQAQEATFELDPARTTVEITLGASLHSVHGTFKAKSGKIRFDLSSSSASGVFVIDATTGDTGSQMRDRKMHKQVLESEKYPEISFAPSRITGAVAPQGDSTVQVEGILKLHGADHAMTLSVPVRISGNDLTANLHFVIPYVEWGLKNPSNLVLHVSKEVEISISARGHFAPPGPSQ